MPLVRIALMKRNQKDFGTKIGAIVYRAMVDTIAVPADDNFQVITEHDADTLIYDPGYLGIRRSDGFVAVQITMSETIGVEGRGAFYDTVGAIRDVVQNHLLQVLAFVAMEPPAAMSASCTRESAGSR